jgi:hypothetical protein
MAQKEQLRTVYRTAKGREVDMTKLVSQNEMTIAVGNMSVNARGDKIGPGGKIVAKREQLQPASSLIPEQVSVRKPQPEVAKPQPQPEIEVPIKPLTPTQKAKAIKDMDPEGLE